MPLPQPWASKWGASQVSSECQWSYAPCFFETGRLSCVWCVQLCPQSAGVAPAGSSWSASCAPGSWWPLEERNRVPGKEDSPLGGAEATESVNRAENLKQMHIHSSEFLGRTGEPSKGADLTLQSWCRNTMENCVSIKKKNIKPWRVRLS